MKSPAIRILAIILVLTLLPAFSPAARAEEQEEALTWAAARGILTGSTAEAPDPDRPCSRGEVAALLWRCAGKPTAAGETTFSDVAPFAWYAEAVAWAEEAGILQGQTDGGFHPNLLCSRGQLSLVLWRRAGSPAAGTGRLPEDLRPGDPRRAAIAWVLAEGLLDPTDPAHFSPGLACTRGEVLVALRRMAGPEEPRSRKGLIVIDPGHQRMANTGQEPLGPGSAETKGKVSGGTYGAASGLAEYELTLTVSLQLRDELERRGYEVRLTRETHDVDISNKERAEFANALGADCAIRIHANGLNDPEIHGALTINMSRNSPFNAWLYPRSRALSEALLDSFCAATGAARRPIWDTDTMVGINWSQVPVSIVEMGYMTNPQEDLLMATAEYQAKMVQGLADGVDVWFAEQEQD